MNPQVRRVVAGIMLGLVVGFFVSLANGRDVAAALGSGLGFALIVGVTAGLIAWAIAIAEGKGYNAWVGMLALVVLNVGGILLLLLLPARNAGANHSVPP